MHLRLRDLPAESRRGGVMSARMVRLAGGMLCALLLAGCRSGAPHRLAATVELRVEPQPPRVGPVTMTVLLTTPERRPLPGADVRLEGNMAHPGMTPVFAAARESEPGSYSAPFELTMAGDWFITIFATAPDGRRLERELPLPGVRSR